MKKLISAFKIVAMGACSPVAHLPAGTASPSFLPKQEHKLVWADEFNTDGPPDTTNWMYEQGFVRNEEVQWYQKENARCQGGLLVIEGRKELKPSPWFKVNSDDWRGKAKIIEYTSSSIKTQGKQQWQYGRFEMRGRIDISSGLWPAWWTLGVDGRWPANGEIDIMEYYNGKLLANIACKGSDGRPEWYSNRFPVDSLGGKDWASQFHTWRMDWDEKAIALFIDGQLLNRVELEILDNKDGSGFNPFKQPHFMLLNLAMGGHNGGSLEHTAFPNRFEVDYVRVYQQE